MINDSIPVKIRSSFEAQNFWIKNAENLSNITESFRIIENNNNSKKEKISKDKIKYVFSLKEIESFQLPYQKQQQPFEKNNNDLDKENINPNLKPPQKGHYPSPIRIRSSRSIEREVFQRDLELDELRFQDHKRKIIEMSQRYKDVLTINKALAGHQQRFYIL